VQICAELFDEALKNRARITRVIDREVWVVAEALRFTAQNCNAGRVESLEPNAVGFPAKQIAHAVTHFGSSLVSKSYGKNL
jgi:hypothetical protein